MNTKHALLAITTFAFGAICTTGYAQNNGSAVSDTTKNAALDEEEYELIEFPEKLPEFPGGERALRKFIAKNLNYPEEAKNKKIEGKVWIHFVVSKTGDIEDVKVVKGVDPLLDNEAIRIVQSMPKWKTGKKRGKPVDCPITIPILFPMEKNKKH